MYKKTLALNMIVGPNDAGLLERCLSNGNLYKFFDEIILIPTTNDRQVIAVVENYATKWEYFPWFTDSYPCGNFGGARNKALEFTKSDYVMWLDCDDIIDESGIEEKFNKLRNYIDENEKSIYVMPYILKINSDGLPEEMILRERIINNKANIKWKYPVHEQLTIDWEIHSRVDLTGLEILHLPLKMEKESVNRNLQILGNEYFKGDADLHLQYYFARELFNSGDRASSIPILMELINNYDGKLKSIYDVCMLVANYFIYTKVNEDSKANLREDTLDIGESIIRIAIAAVDQNAEPFVYFGDIQYGRKNYQAAIDWYKQAMTKKLGTGYLQNKAYYEEIPARRLSNLYHCINENEQAIWYNKLALNHSPNEQFLRNERKEIIKELVNTL